MLRAFISSRVAIPIAQAKLFSLMRRDNSSRWFAESRFESFTPRSCLPGARMTAAAYTEPAQAPHPTSSTPAIKWYP